MPAKKLRQLIPLTEFQAEWAIYFGYHCHRFPLPTEVVIGTYQVIAPLEARAYNTNLYVYKDHIVSYEWLQHLYHIRGDSFPGTACCGADHLQLAEVWEDAGDEGHINFVLVGFRFVPYKDLQDFVRYPYLNNYGSASKVPRCMLPMDVYDAA